jgi:hypothetical protein
VKEKVRAIAKLEARYDEFRRITQRQAAADRAEIERLTERLYQEHGVAIHQLRSAVSVIEQASPGNIPEMSARHASHGSLTLRLEKLSVESDAIRQVNRDLETKLNAANLARERAESRFSQVSRELQAQRGDLMMLATQFTGVEGQTSASQDHMSQIQRLQASVLDKEIKLRGLREALVKLKTEFVTSEEVKPKPRV